MTGLYWGSDQVSRGAGGFAHNCSLLGYSGLRVQIPPATISPPPSQLSVSRWEGFFYNWWTELVDLADPARAVKVPSHQLLLLSFSAVVRAPRSDA